MHLQCSPQVHLSSVPSSSQSGSSSCCHSCMMYLDRLHQHQIFLLESKESPEMWHNLANLINGILIEGSLLTNTTGIVFASISAPCPQVYCTFCRAVDPSVHPLLYDCPVPWPCWCQIWCQICVITQGIARSPRTPFTIDTVNGFRDCLQ